MSEHVGRISEGWADEARTAALDARKRAHPDWRWGPTGAEKRLGIVHVSHSDIFGEGPHVADFQSFTPDGKRANVSLHLDDDHPAVQGARGDFPEMDPDQMEWLDTVPVDRVSYFDPVVGRDHDVRNLAMAHAAEVDQRLHAAQKAAAVQQNQERRAAAPPDPAGREARRRELSAGLRTTPLSPRGDFLRRWHGGQTGSDGNPDKGRGQHY